VIPHGLTQSEAGDDALFFAFLKKNHQRPWNLWKVLRQIMVIMADLDVHRCALNGSNGRQPMFCQRKSRNTVSIEELPSGRSDVPWRAGDHRGTAKIVVCVLDMRYRYDYILYIDYIVYIDYILYNIYYICDLLNWWTILSIFRDIILYNYFLRVKLVSDKIGKIGGIIIGRCVRKVREGCIIIPMTDPWCWYIMFFYANMNGVFVDIHGAPYIAAPLGSVMGSGYWWSAIWRWRREASAIGDHHAALWEPQLDGGRGAGTALYTWLPRYDQFSSAPYII
jgi:hypothetical protein